MGAYAQYVPKELRQELIRYGDPWPQYIDRLPKDLQRQLFIRLPYKAILKLCKDPYFFWICEDEIYWAQRADVSVEYLRRYSRDRPLPESYFYAKYHERTLADIVALEDPDDFPATRLFFAVEKVVRQAIKMEDFPLLHYLLLEYIRNDITLLLDNMSLIRKHPKVLCWFKDNNVDLSQGEMDDLIPLILPAYKAGKFKVVKCLQKVTRLSWDDILKEFAQWTDNRALVKRILDKGWIKDPRTIEDAYRIAFEMGNTEMAKFLRSYLA